MKHVSQICNILVGAIALIGVAGVASAGAPTAYGDRSLDQSALLISPDEYFDPIPHLSPAEIRNAVSVRMDRNAQRGVDVDRASVDGIGLERTPQDRLVEAR